MRVLLSISSWLLLFCISHLYFVMHSQWWLLIWFAGVRCEPLPPPVPPPVSTGDGDHPWSAPPAPASLHNKYQSNWAVFWWDKQDAMWHWPQHHCTCVQCTPLYLWVASRVKWTLDISLPPPPPEHKSTTKKTVNSKLSKTVNCNRIKQLKYNTH